jgi:tRNA U34 5-carboxymethylaminomethyl modifying enzyme MnmG/GidA
MTLRKNYDVAIVGAGVCGTEAALACARAGLDVLLVTTILDSCYNLAGEGAVLQPVAGTFMAEAVRQLSDARGFVNTWTLHRAAKYALEHTPGIHFLQSSVSSVIVEDREVKGINTWEGVPRFAGGVALCVGSFLEARLTVGSLTENAGRLSEMSYDDLYLGLLGRGFVFEPLRLQAEAAKDSLPYTVDCKVFAPGEIDKESFGSSRLQHLYAAGICAFGYMTYEQAAAQGRNLAIQLAQKASIRSGVRGKT